MIKIRARRTQLFIGYYVRKHDHRLSSSVMKVNSGGNVQLHVELLSSVKL